MFTPPDTSKGVPEWAQSLARYGLPLLSHHHEPFGMKRRNHVIFLANSVIAFGLKEYHLFQQVANMKLEERGGKYPELK